MLSQMARFHSFFYNWVIFPCGHVPSSFLYLFVYWWKLVFWLEPLNHSYLKELLADMQAGSGGGSIKTMASAYPSVRDKFLLQPSLWSQTMQFLSAHPWHFSNPCLNAGTQSKWVCDWVNRALATKGHLGLQQAALSFTQSPSCWFSQSEVGGTSLPGPGTLGWGVWRGLRPLAHGNGTSAAWIHPPPFLNTTLWGRGLPLLHLQPPNQHQCGFFRIPLVTQDFCFASLQAVLKEEAVL